MSKELVISATRHETRVATLEDDQLVEIAIERASEHALAGNIYKGRVSRVLPGMQSAFVKIGLERDAFLYVSDVLDETAELESGALDDDEDALLAVAKAAPALVESDGESEAEAKERPRRGERRGKAESPAPPPAPRADRQDDASQRDRRGRRGRRRRGRGGREGSSSFPEEKFAAVEGSEGVEETPRRRLPEQDETETRVTRSGQAEVPEDDDDLLVLPGESLAKYSGRGFTDEDDIEYESEDGQASEEPGEDEPSPAPLGESETEAAEEPEPAAALAKEDQDEDDQDPEPEDRFTPEDEPERLEIVEQAESLPEDGEDSPESPAAEDSEDDAETGQAAAEGEGEDGEPASGQAEVRERGNSRYLRRGRRGRRRGGRGRRDGRESNEAAPSEAPAAEEQAEDERREPEIRAVADVPERRADAKEASIADLLKPGQEVIVQVAKEPLGKKGARITAHVALPGRHLVYMPTVSHVGVSRKIGSDAERARLRRVIKDASAGIPGGFIVRTAGQGASDEELQEDIRFLANLWKAIKEKAEKRPAPTMLHQDLDVVERFLRDQLGQNFKTIWVDSEDHYERIVQFVERFQPDLLDRVKLYTRSKPIFDEFKITTELEKALRPKVWLKSGGYIVINQTEALVAIDVNTGKYVGKSDRLEDTIVKTNLEAVQEVVRQMRLRDLGGIIVVDFIDMDDRSNRKKVAQALEKEMRLDRAPSKALSFNDFGLVAITRKRVKQSLERALCSPCPTCEASGYVKSPTTVILEILDEVRKLAPKMKDVKDVTLRVNPDVARVLKSRENTFLQEIEDGLKVNVLVRGDLSLHRENFDFNV